MPQSVQTKMAHGAIWMVLFKTFERTIGLISTLILVRLLLPTDFGLISMALSFIQLAELLTAFGFDVALIHNQETTDEHYHSAWTLHIIMGATITIMMIAAANPIASFYNEPAVFWVVCALALVPFIRGIENIGVVAFRKELDFRKEFWFQLNRKFIGFFVTIPIAILFRSYWALVAGTIASQLFATAYSYRVHHFRPRLCAKEIRSLMHFSKWLLLNNTVGYLKERLSIFFIGRLHGAAPLGLFEISYTFAHLPTTELSAPINRALLPGFAKIADDKQALNDSYTNSVKILALFALPAAAGIFAVAPYMVPVVLGHKWLDATPLLQILSINGALILFHSNMCNLLIAIGYPKLVAKVNTIYVVIILISLFALARFGVQGAAYATLLATILATPFYFYYMNKMVGIGLFSFISAIARPLIASLIMIIIIHYCLPVYTDAMSLISAAIWLMAGIAIGVASYILVVFLQWLALGRPNGAEELVISKIKELIQTRIAKFKTS